MMRKELTLAFFLSLLVFLLSWSYYVYFSEALDNNEWENVNGFTRIIIPDTFYYLKITGLPDPIVSILFAGLKNTIVPSLIWFMANGQWVLVSLVNSLFLFIGLMYFAKTARLLNVPSQKILFLMALLALLPATVFHSVGALKEIPNLLFLMGFFYHYLKGDRARWLLYALLCVLLRYQLVFPLFLFLVADRFRQRALLFAFCVLIVMAAIYPYIHSLAVFAPAATEKFRELYGTEGSLGGIIEHIRETMPGLSIIAVLIRVIQSIFEPLITFVKKPSFYEDGDLSIILTAYFISSIILFRYWLLFLKRIVSLLANPANTPRNVIRLYMFCLVFIFPIAGLSYIHYRYTYPFTGFVLVAGAVGLETRGSLVPHIETQVCSA